MSIFRQYTRDDSFTNIGNVRQIIPFLKEYQIALAFARDYDVKDNPTNGNFTPYWNVEKVTPASIIQFKKDNPNVKINVLISIGDRDAKFPFNPIDRDSWISNATRSIRNIIRNNFQLVRNIVGIGIDVYYEHIEDEDLFAFCIGQLIKKLKEVQVISFASIAPSFNLQTHYFKLYQKYSDFIDLVDYQFYNEVEPIPNPASLIKRYEIIASKFYPKEKLLAGYSSVRKDWSKLVPIVFFLGGSFLVVTNLAQGASIWDIELLASGWGLLPFGVAMARELPESNTLSKKDD
ncbi:hypothetical protein L6164_023397 [Bauhinia variegata]|uniref:Uncharacterized protein n=1 Tax=Bauhinia variegata TaxID=167791 RepID=A0ACB9MI26_BAUVA|nr:hypothetical protein L6164_023397 [Bauhinia variegata]